MLKSTLAFHLLVLRFTKTKYDKTNFLGKKYFHFYRLYSQSVALTFSLAKGGVGVFFAGAGGEKPEVCTALISHLFYCSGQQLMK